jgi:hypothetical protein
VTGSGGGAGDPTEVAGTGGRPGGYRPGGVGRRPGGGQVGGRAVRWCAGRRRTRSGGLQYEI